MINRFFSLFLKQWFIAVNISPFKTKYRAIKAYNNSIYVTFSKLEKKHYLNYFQSFVLLLKIKKQYKWMINPKIYNYAQINTINKQI